MTRILWVALGCLLGTPFAAKPITFHKDAEPILQANRQGCHRPGQTAPMSLPSYESALPWAKAVKNAVLTQKMPPWFADPKGTRMKVTAHFDNSVNNKFNPDPNQTVYYGDMTWEEMMFPFSSVTVDPSVNTKKVIRIIRGKEGDGA